MRTHLGCTGRVELGKLSPETQQRLEKIPATWLEIAPETNSLVVRHVQPDDVPALREITGELFDYLTAIQEQERRQIPGGALYYLDEQTGQSVRIKVWEGAFVTVAWAQPDYSRAKWERYREGPTPVVFDAYQRLNGVVKFQPRLGAVEEVQVVIDHFSGLYPQGEFEAMQVGDNLEVRFFDVNASVLELIQTLKAQANPAASLEGEIDVSSFRSGDVEDYCRFAIRGGEIWIARPNLWADLPQAPPKKVETAA
ncbi:MAG: hypothetical protein HY508_05595 [Acidobacteria bacterium]|nr:hypothetical protein [Acidobacteriota bacterium]